MTNETMYSVLSGIFTNLNSIPGIGTLIRIMQTAGILFIAYLIFLFVKGFFQYKGFSRIKRIENKLEDVCTILSNIEKNVASPAKEKVKNKK